MTYTAPASKEFQVVSQSGEKWIIGHVFKRLLEAEREAAEGENWKHTALDHQNYNFTSVAADGADKCALMLWRSNRECPPSFCTEAGSG